MMAAVEQANIGQGESVVLRARGWLGTPYRHQASCKGAGTDCLGLLRGLWREMFGTEPESVPPYTADWSETAGQDLLLEAARRCFQQVERKEADLGDVLVLRMADGAPAKHVGILAHAREGHRTLIHAYSGHGVVESTLTPAWSRRVVGVFRFPSVRV